MSDLIDRQAEIDAICKACSMVEDYHKCDYYPETSILLCDELVALRALPSVQFDHVADIGKKVSISCDHENDVISRKMAIEALARMMPHSYTPDGSHPADEEIFRAQEIFVDCIEALEILPSAQPEQRWIPCSERLPSETVIVTVETKTFKHRYVCEAVWIPRWTLNASFDEWEDCSEYNEDDDEYYVLEGWYERVHNWDEYAYVGIDDNVIAWMPLPEAYEGGDSE